MPNKTAKIYGWYDSPHQPKDKPTYNPPFNSPCPYCDAALTDGNIRTHSMMMQNAPQAFFFRTHKTCDEAATPEQKQAIDDKLWDMIAEDKVFEIKPHLEKGTL